MGRRRSLAAEDVTPSIKHVAVPCDPPLRIVHCVLLEVVRMLPIPGDNAVFHCIVQNGGLSGIEILHRVKVWWRTSAFPYALWFRMSGPVEPNLSEGSILDYVFHFAF